VDPLEPVLSEFDELLARISAALSLQGRPDVDFPSKFAFISARLHKFKADPSKVAEILSSTSFRYLRNVRVENLYINADVDPSRLAEELFKAVYAMGDRYGYSDRCTRGNTWWSTRRPTPYIRCTWAMGATPYWATPWLDSSASAEGVEVHFYVDDCGSQSCTRAGLRAARRRSTI
jgi:hypothetical protein